MTYAPEFSVGERVWIRAPFHLKGPFTIVSITNRSIKLDSGNLFSRCGWRTLSDYYSEQLLKETDPELEKFRAKLRRERLICLINDACANASDAQLVSALSYLIPVETENKPEGDSP